MKSMIAVALFSVISISSALADNLSQLVCSTAPSPTGGTLNIVIPPFTGDTAVLKGTENGGEAHFIALVGPYNVKVSYEADMITYSNSEEGIEFTVITTSIDGRVLTTASYKQGNEPVESLTCHFEEL